MPEPRPDSPSTFRIPIAYTDEELASYERIIVRRQKQSAGPAAGGGVIATGVVVALLGGFLGVAAGIVSPRGGSLLAVLVFGGFWIGAWASVIWSKRRTARILLARRDAFRADLRNASILVTNAGIFTRSNTIRSFYAFSAIKASSQEGGFVLLWTRRNPRSRSRCGCCPRSSAIGCCHTPARWCRATTNLRQSFCYAPTSAFAGSTACTTRPRARASITPTARNASSVTV
jgi:hypothetical protein